MKIAYLYVWSGFQIGGHWQEGLLCANSREQVQLQLFEKKIIPIKITKKHRFSNYNWSKTHTLILLKQLAMMLNSGLPLLKSLTLLKDQQTQLCWSFVLQQLIENLLRGFSFCQCIQKFPQIFPPLYQQLIATGELSGKLEGCLLQLVEQQQLLLDMRLKFRKALRYPIFILITAFLVCLLMLFVVLPEFESIYQSMNASLPIFTQALLDFSDFLSRSFYWLIALLLLSILFYRRYLSNSIKWSQSLQSIFIHFPLYKRIYDLNTLMLFFQTLSMTQKANINLLQALEEIEKHLTHSYYYEQITQLVTTIQRGESFSKALSQHNLFPPLSHQLIQIGEETGQLETLLSELAEIYYRQLEQCLQQFSQFIEPVMLLILAMIIGSLLLAIYLPIFQLGNLSLY